MSAAPRRDTTAPGRAALPHCSRRAPAGHPGRRPAGTDDKGTKEGFPAETEEQGLGIWPRVLFWLAPSSPRTQDGARTPLDLAQRWQDDTSDVIALLKADPRVAQRLAGAAP